MGIVQIKKKAAQAQRKKIRYNIIASLPNSHTSLNVVVDNQSFPLHEISGILFSTEAPTARKHYYYSMYDNGELIASESFLRSPVSENTVNECFNRSKNIYKISPLPQVYPPLPVISRIRSNLHVEGQIATIHLWGNQEEIDNMHHNQLDDIAVRLNMVYIGLNEVQSFENVKVSTSGRSSKNLSKLSYTVKFNKKDGSALYGYKNFKLRALAMDPSYIREYISFSSIKAAGISTTGFSYVRVFMNNKPLGLFGLIETFQGTWLSSEFAYGNKEYKPGKLYQGILADYSQTEIIISDLKYLGENLTRYNLGEYKIKAGDEQESDKAFSLLKNFTKFVNEATAETSVKEWEEHLDTKSFIRSMALEDLLGFSDGYMTMANNYYLYSDPERDGRMIYIPADLDTTIGNTLYPLQLMLSGNYSEHPGFNFRPLTIKLFSNPTLLKEYKETILQLTEELINPLVMVPRIDSVIDMIRSDVEWDSLLTRVGSTYATGLEKQIKPSDRLKLETFLKLFPPGYKMDNGANNVSITFEQAVNGPINSDAIESVKGFITKKTEAVRAFFTQL